VTWIAVALTVGTTLVGMEEQHRAAKKQDSALAAQLRQQAAAEDKVRQRTSQFIQGQQQQTDQPQKTAAAKQYDAALAANQHQSDAPLATVGNVSDAYKKAGSDAALGISNFGSNLGHLTASIDAPGLQRQANQRNINDFGIDVNQINRGQKGQDFIDQLKLNGIHSNPYIGLLTGVAGAYARAKLGAGANTGGADPWSGGVSDSGGTFDVNNPGGIYG